MAMTSSASMSTMNMAFNTDNLSTMLFSSAWMPTSTGDYVGTWFFLFFLAVIWRAISAKVASLDAFWASKNAGYPIFINGGQEKPSREKLIQTWRLSVNLPRAALRMLNQGISYLLMIAVMTMNVGFFFAVLVGYFVGELVFGRVGGANGGS
ncbi:Ctr copper transporter [Penicillium maclennaniae]|uniref:Ctr copper transporter n=1 Tax=Penicillium maclennaniae TaxID=1343394 RepID=UPI0025416EF7|nr:Ctr copper transporter [Penicillium maclennaniae]KAJ5684888.1 Ctr copper transporter [Penicillium maclennaniae]